jgi:hemerythrin superfamily protein
MRERNDAPHYPIDAIALLKADHRKVEDLFQQYQHVRDKHTKQSLADQVCAELELHAQLEEMVFYPAVAEAAGEAGEQLMEDACQDHQLVKDLIAELEEVHDREFDIRFHALMHEVQSHIAQEEHTMFPVAEQLLADQLEDLLAEMVALKNQLPTATWK